MSVNRGFRVGASPDLALLHTDDVPSNYLALLSSLWTLRKVDYAETRRGHLLIFVKVRLSSTKGALIQWTPDSQCRLYEWLLTNPVGAWAQDVRPR